MNWETFAGGVAFSLAGSALGWALGGLLRSLFGKPPLPFRRQASLVIPSALGVAAVVGAIWGLFT